MDSPLGIVAGSGQLPQDVVAYCVQHNRPYFIIAYEDFTDPTWVAAHPHAYVTLGHMGRAIELLKENGVQQLVLAGAIKRPSLKQLKPDLLTAKWVAEASLTIFGDDSLLRFIIKKLEECGLEVMDARAFLGQEALATQGSMGAALPDEDLPFIRKGVEICKTLGACDVGQALIMQQEYVLAVEAAEGTDALIKRTIPLIKEGPRPYLIKMAKPQQDLRVDRPTVGLNTLKACHAAGFAGIIVEAGAVFLMERAAMIAYARAHGLVLSGWVHGA